MFREVDSKQSFPQLEAEIAGWWRSHAIVQQAQTHGDHARPFVFFEGPPTANGHPGVHTIEPRVFKDVIIRYHRMRGQYVIGARGGWDTHGLPVELEVEKALGFKQKADIERYGIDEFNKACRESVWRYVQEFEDLQKRLAYWLDHEHSYATCTNDYVESLWWIFKTLWQKDLLFRDYKVTMHCPRCGTALSDHEVAQGFRDNVDDPSVWLRFRHRPAQHALDAQLAGSSLLAWTTTPWTLPANTALAVKPGAAYALVEYTAGEGPERLLLAQALVEQVLGAGNYTLLATFTGDDLRDLRYEPLFKGVPQPGAQIDWEQAYRVIVDEFVSLEDGTGIVHIAPAYGDLEIGRKYGLPTLFSVDQSGMTLPDFAPLGFGNLFFKRADSLIAQYLKERGLLFRQERVRHSYPFCWRCDTPLLYYAKPSWYIRTTAYKERLLAHNERINWVPEHIKHGRFGNWLENNIDWAVSRERYWGTPLPIWLCDSCSQAEVIGSLAELAQHAGRDLPDLDLHRPYVDKITWPCRACGQGTSTRVLDVADAWFDSGSMPIAQWHYPFENHETFAVAGQADFICEAIDQTRGWFYTLLAISTLLFDRPAYKNVICLGLILDAKGQKMSKSRGNMVDSGLLLDTYGADATRWFMYSSAPPYNPRNFSLEYVAEMQRQFLLTLWNTYAFFVTYANVDGWQPTVSVDLSSLDLPLIDRWVLSRLNSLVRTVTAMFEAYDVYSPTREIAGFVEDLSNWYVRRNRRRFWKAENDTDKQAAYVTLYTCLTTLAKLLAPFTPYVSEALYQNLVAGHVPVCPESVHLAMWPEVHEDLIDEQLLTDMALLQEIVSLGRAARQKAGLRVRQPLSELLVRVTRAGQGEDNVRPFADIIREELNIKQVRFLTVNDELVEYYLKPNLPVLGKKLGRLIPAIKVALAVLTGEATTKAAHALAAGEAIPVAAGGQQVQLQPGDVLVEARAPAGYAVASAEGLVVALNTILTPALVQEGLARDLVRLVQDARKAAGLAITDHIALALQPIGLTHLDPLITAYHTYLCTETLADEILIGPIPEGFSTTEAELEGGRIVIGVRPSAGA